MDGIVKTFAIGDVKTLAEEEKTALVEYCKSAFTDETVKKAPGAVKNILLTQEGDYQYKLVFEQEKKRQSRPVEKSIKELGLSGEASKKLIRDFKAGLIKRYHLKDIKFLSDLLRELTPTQQKKGIDIIVANRRDFYQANKEELSLLILDGGQTGAYFIDLWYRGLIRAFEKTGKLLRADRTVFSEADPEQKKQLKKYFKRTGDRISEVKPALK